ncbi:type III secretion system protein [Burkholderia ubonensis]|uniref:Type III secretion system protein n=1 Tax=Burkholderia ubonensis TaxID=101571 RepID=A0AB73FXN7_9BURK|nr:type III secretion system export apparatus subunit SctT [Burkholderia ubonensis]KVK72775.1 type III secretion system protein [Burkholderia ubonensis]KVL62248.1 type III secretion system protein [Burkholderia ubonensis]KVM22016.1 type III secretion system protein [Burkholderia ubonensis]KVM33604.1 type III secretion system protein [Burkholderia ubonensis]
MNELVSALPLNGRGILEYLSLLGVCSLRLAIVMIIFPPAGDGALQGTVRNGLVLLFSAYIAYGQPVEFMGALRGGWLVQTIVREAAIGFLLAFAASTVFWAVQSVGVYIDSLTGYNSIQIINPVRSEQSTPISTLFGQIANTAFWALGGGVVLLGTLYESYGWWPISSEWPSSPAILSGFLLQQTDTLMQTIAKLAAPMAFMLLLVDFGFAFAAKSAPKLDLMNLSQPAKALLAIVILALFAGLFIDQVHGPLTLAGLSERLREIALRADR